MSSSLGGQDHQVDLLHINTTNLIYNRSVWLYMLNKFIFAILFASAPCSCVAYNFSHIVHDVLHDSINFAWLSSKPSKMMDLALSSLFSKSNVPCTFKTGAIHFDGDPQFLSNRNWFHLRFRDREVLTFENRDVGSFFHRCLPSRWKILESVYWISTLVLAVNLWENYYSLASKNDKCIHFIKSRTFYTKLWRRLSRHARSRCPILTQIT